MRKKLLGTTFSKFTVAFLFCGLLPLVLLSSLLFAHFETSIKNNMIDNYEHMVSIFADNVDAMIDETDNALGNLYNYQSKEDLSFTNILKDENMEDSQKTFAVTDALGQVMLSSDYISSLRFVDNTGKVYNLYKDMEKIPLSLADNHTSMNIMSGENDLRSMKVLGAIDESEVCLNSTDFVFCITRNYMDTSSIEKTATVALGTIFADISVDQIDVIADKMGLTEEDCYIYDAESGRYIYSRNTEVYYDGLDPLANQADSFIDERGSFQEGEKWYFYHRVGQTNVYAVVQMGTSALVGSVRGSQLMMILIIAFSSVFLMVLYMMFSVRMNDPIKKIKEGMEAVEQGNLNVRLHVNTNDEMEYVADGFNSMVEKLTDYINQVYEAEICRKDAELSALKMQIRPHYLYNTLDVIRMTALDQEDEVTAELLESLAYQLRYVIGNQKDRTTLAEEMKLLQQYFVIAKVRYEGRISLEINLSDQDKELYVPKMLLQPIVENSVKHGLREKEGNESVSISISRRAGYLEIVVMDDGVGMETARAKRIQEILDNPTIGYTGENHEISIGMKNVYDRIKLNCGPEYGMTIDSVIGMGTIVIMTLPIWTQEEEE